MLCAIRAQQIKQKPAAMAGFSFCFLRRRALQ
jgi:hypothetical protein